METYRLLAADGAGAAEGLALDEALMAGYARGAPPRPPTLRLYTYRDHVALVGRYQNLEAEVDLQACRRSGTGVNRRPTGGGAIVMGEGQLGVAMATRADPGERPAGTLRRLSRGIVAGLAELGIAASFRGKNDLEVRGRKIAGLGLYRDGAGALLFHASVLADLDVPFMLRVLRIPLAKLGEKAVAAVEDRVTTVSRELDGRWTGAALRGAVARGFARAFGAEPEQGEPRPDELALAEELLSRKYGTAAWLHERSAHRDSTGSAVVKTPAGLLRLDVALHGDVIKSAAFTGDFNEAPAPLAGIEAALRWARVDERGLSRLVVRACGGETGLGIGPEAIVGAVLTAARGETASEARVTPARVGGSCYFPAGGAG